MIFQAPAVSADADRVPQDESQEDRTMKPDARTDQLLRHVERLLRRLGLVPPKPQLVIARVPRRRHPWPPPR